MDHDSRHETTPASSSSTGWLGLGLLAAAPLILGFGFYLGRDMLRAVHAAPGEAIEPVTTLPSSLFKGWKDPQLVVVVTGQTFGYLQPCGCSSPQFGGLTRRYNVVQLLKKQGWPVSAIDLGELYPKKNDLPEVAEQAKEKYKTVLKSLSVIGYQTYGIGLPELKMPLIQGLAEALALNLKQPSSLSLNLQDPDNTFSQLGVRSYEILEGKAKIGVTSLVGPGVAKQFEGDPQLKFFRNPAILPVALQTFAKNKVDLVVLLYHGTEAEARECAKFCDAEKQKNPALPTVDLILHTSDFDTPPARPDSVPGTPTKLLFMGHKGKYLGALGVFTKPGGGVDWKYELVSIGPEFDTPKGAEKDHPVMKLMDDYAKNVKDNNFLEKFKALREEHPTQRSDVLKKLGVEAKYVGNEVCAGCHPAADAKWKTTGHSHAFETLEKAEKPSLRQFDPECVICHTTGFKYNTGFFDAPAGAAAKQIEKHNTKLLNVGCESCHGPGSMHANNPNNKDFLPLINPIKLDVPGNMLKLDFFCQKCHDIENDVHWGSKKPFAQSWMKIAHPEPKKKADGE